MTETQRRVITARDQGCTFPACPEPPSRCQVDHVIRHEHDGPTGVDNGHLLCRYNHREHERQGWKPTMINGVPHRIHPGSSTPTKTAPQHRARHRTPHHGTCLTAGIWSSA